MPGRKYSAGGSYRYGFNGKEVDKETSSTTTYDYGFRIYNPTLGRFLSTDPLTNSFPYYTPYQFAGNMPIAAKDLDGLEQYVVIHYKDQQGNITSIQIRTVEDLKGSLQDQLVHKLSATKKIAKGNVLVFESYQSKNNTENLQVVDSRNHKGSKLNAQELKIYQKQKEQESEDGETQSLDYGGPPKQYLSKDFESAETNTFNSFGNIPVPHPVPFQGQIIIPHGTFHFEAIPVYGDQNTPIPSSVEMAKDLGRSLRNTGVTSIIIQPRLFDASGGEGANTIQSNGKTFIQNEFEQYQKFGEIIKKISGGQVNVKVNYPLISKTSLEGRKLDIQTK